MKHFTWVVMILLIGIGCSSAMAQSGAVNTAELDKDLQLMRQDLRSEKKKIIAVNVPFTDVEATKFWPVYDQYAAEMTRNYDDFYKVITDYAANQKTLTDPQALTMVKQWADVQVKITQTRQKYIPLFEKVAPGKKVALFLQIDRRLYGLMDLQIASAIPLVLQ
jgi:hypothetical protein